MKRETSILRACISLFFIGVMCLSFIGCAFGSFGKADFTGPEIKVPAGINGKSKSGILKTLGVPDSVVNAEGTEYWSYKNKKGTFVFLFGGTKEKDLVLEFKDSKVSSSYLVDKGSSVGIFAAQGAVAN